jgi:RNA-directed DNA polymerase
MGAERQQGGFYQTFLFEDWEENSRPDQGGEARSQSARPEEPQAATALDPARALTVNLMEEVTDRDNLNHAYRRVKANKGSAGVDGLTVDDLSAWVADHKDALISSLLDGTYQPQPVRGVQIPKPGGGVRQLGIPTVVDRLVQQAILQVLEKILDPTFSESSFGFRRPGARQGLRGRGTHHRGGPRSGEILRPGEP